MKITGVILAGGWGTRMEKVCDGIPKAILEFNGIPFLAYLVDWLRTCCNEVIIAAGHNSNHISVIFNQDIWRKKNVKVIGERVPLGTGGAIRLAVLQSTNNVVFVCNGDTVVSDINVAKIVKRHLVRNSQITAILTKNEDMVQNRGAITIQSNLVIGFEEGRGDKRMNSNNASSTGCYVMNKEFVLKHFSVQDEKNHREVSLERELLPLFVAMDMVDAFIVERNRFFIDFGNPLRYEMLKRKEGVILQIYKKGDALPHEGWVFIIDPIDGTSEFSRGSHEWSISLSAVNNLVSQVGMLILPQDNLRFSACRGIGVTCNGKTLLAKEQSGSKKRIAVSPRQIQIPEFKARIQKSGLKPIPISTLTIKIVSILLERADAGIYFSQEGKSANIWDYAAAILLLEEFGGKMTSLDGSPMPFSGQKIIHRDGWLATNGSCDHNELLMKLQ